MAEHVSFLTREIFIVYLFLFYKIYSQYEKKKKKKLDIKWSNEYS